MVERALAASDPAEVEPQNGKSAVHKRVVELVNDLMVHRAAELRVRVQHDRNGSMLDAGRVIAAFDPAGGTGKDDFGHSDLDLGPQPWERRVARRRPG